MYDSAKRGVAFAVATGGLLLTGPGLASAEAATGISTLGGPVAAQAGAETQQTVRIDAAQSEAGLRPHAVGPRIEVSRAVAVGLDTSGGVLSGNSVSVPVTLGVNACGNSATVLAAASSGSDCSGSGGAGPAAAASTRSARPGGLLSGNTITAPIGVPVNVCGNSVSIAGIGGHVHGASCSVGSAGLQSGTGTGSGTSTGTGTGTGTGSSVGSSVGGIGLGTEAGVGGALGLGAALGGLGNVLSANSVHVPINVPIDACGNGVVAAAAAIPAAVSCTYAIGAAVQSVAVQPPAASAPAASSASVPISLPAGIPAASSATTAGRPCPGEAATSSTAMAVPAAKPVPQSAPGVATSAQQQTAPTAPQGATSQSTTSQGAAAQPVAPAALTAAAPQGTVSTNEAPITVHPLVIWPRPEPAALPIAPNRSHVHPAAEQGTEQAGGPRTAHGPMADPPGAALAHTGGEMLLPLGAAGSTLSAGLGLRASGRRRKQS